MRTKAHFGGLIATISPVLSCLTACATPSPVMLSSQFTPPNSPLWSSSQTIHADDNSAGTCRIRLADIQDMRADPQEMGEIGGRPIREADEVAWLRSGLMSLSRDSRIRIVDATATEKLDIDLSVELLKAYVMSITSDKSTNVVMRVHYAQQGTSSGEKIYRGTDTGVNWISGQGETQASLDYAFDQILEGIDRDVRARCGSVKLPVHSENP